MVPSGCASGRVQIAIDQRLDADHVADVQPARGRLAAVTRKPFQHVVDAQSIPNVRAAGSTYEPCRGINDAAAGGVKSVAGEALTRVVSSRQEKLGIGRNARSRRAFRRLAEDDRQNGGVHGCVGFDRRIRPRRVLRRAGNCGPPPASKPERPRHPAGRWPKRAVASSVEVEPRSSARRGDEGGQRTPAAHQRRGRRDWPADWRGVRTLASARGALSLLQERRGAAGAAADRHPDFGLFVPRPIAVRLLFPRRQPRVVLWRCESAPGRRWPPACRADGASFCRPGRAASGEIHCTGYRPAPPGPR